MQFRHTLRVLRKSPWYAASAIAVLSVAISLCTVVFAVVDGVLFRSLPYERPHELHVLHAGNSVSPRTNLSPVSWQEIQGWVSATPEVPWTAIGAQVTEFPLDGIAYRIATVDERFFEVLGIRPLLGGFQQEDFDRESVPDKAGQSRSVLISHRLWVRTMNADPGVIGQIVVISERVGRIFAVRVVGVLPPEFLYPIDDGNEQPDLLAPLTHTQQAGTSREFHLILRIGASTDVNSVRERLATATRDLAKLSLPASPHASHGEERARSNFDRVTVDPIAQRLASRHRPALRLTFAAASLLLLAGCLNIAALGAARNIDRQLDFRVRRALGASLWALGKGHLFEVGILVGTATAIALLLARPLLMWTLALLPSTMTLGKFPALDSRVFGAAVVFSLLSGAIASIWPISTIASQERAWPRRNGIGRAEGSTATRTSRQSGSLLVSLQVALGFVLLVAGALTIASLAAAWRNDLGYQRDRMILIEASVRRYVSPADARQQLEAAAAFLDRAPGVERSAVSTIQSTFLRSIDPRSSVIPEGWKVRPEGVNVRQVSRDFFEVMGLELVEGRLPLAGEWQSGSAVALVSRSAARGLWPSRSAVGRTLVSARKDATADAVWSVIGVVADARFEGQARDPAKDVYLPGAIRLGRTGLLFHIRTNGDAEGMLPGLVRDLTAQGLRIDLAATHAAGLFESVKNLALPAWLFGALAVAALLIVVIGVWGLAAMSAAQRTREFGVRLALGATRGRVVRMLIREQLTAVGDGIFVGALISAWVVTFLRSQLYGVGPHDPVAWSVAALTMLAVALVAAAVPALRATAGNPVDVLRAE